MYIAGTKEYGRKRCNNAGADGQKNSKKKRTNKPGAGIMPGMSNTIYTESVHQLYQWFICGGACLQRIKCVNHDLMPAQYTVPIIVCAWYIDKCITFLSSVLFVRSVVQY